MPKKGYKQTKDHRQKGGDVRRGRKMPPRSKIHCENISKAKKGCIPWNKNLTKETDERIARYGKKRKGKNYGIVGNKHPLHKKEIRKNCEVCGKFFWVKESIRDIFKYCSEKETGRKCKQVAQSQRMSGEGNSMYNTHRFGKDNPFYGKHHTIETLKKFRGDKHYNWQNGKSFKSYGKGFDSELRYQIRKRDGFTCQMPNCKIKENGRNHPVHHIDYNKKNNDQLNLITLCISCHGKTCTHRKYWQKHFEQLQRNKWQLCFTILQELRGF